MALGVLRVWVVLALASAMSCGDDPVDPTLRPDAWPSSSGPLDVDIVVTWGGDPLNAWVSMYPREQDRHCLCNAEWPPFDQCVQINDQGQCTCWPFPAVCLTSVSAELDGVVIAGGSAFIPGYVSVDLPGLEDATGTTELVLNGCGGSARIVLPPEPMLLPELETIAYTDSEALLTWSAPSEHTAVSAWCTSQEQAIGCTLPTDSPARVPRDATCNSVSFGVVAGGEPQEMDLGIARVWRYAAINSFNAVYFPELRDDGRRGLPTNAFSPQFSHIEPIVDLVVDGAGGPQLAVVIEASVDLRADDIDATLSVTGLATHRFEFETGATVDQLRVQVGGAWYAGEWAHVEPADGIELGRYRDERYAVGLGSLTLANEDVPGDTIAVSFGIDWNLGVVARPALEIGAEPPAATTPSD